jgi:hypothetical protein
MSTTNPTGPEAVIEAARIIYGDVDIENQYIKVYPPRNTGALTFAIIHGGFWKAQYALDSAMIDTLCPYLLSRGFGVCLIEYRRVGHEGGGWPGTNEDILSALRKFHSISQVSGLYLFQFYILSSISYDHSSCLFACIFTLEGEHIRS